MISFYMTSRAKRYHKIIYSMVYILYYVYVCVVKIKMKIISSYGILLFIIKKI